MSETPLNAAMMLHQALHRVRRPLAMNPWGDEGRLMVALDEALRSRDWGGYSSMFRSLAPLESLPDTEWKAIEQIIQGLLDQYTPLRFEVSFGNLRRRAENVRVRIRTAEWESGTDLEGLARRMEVAIMSRSLVPISRGDEAWVTLQTLDLLWAMGPFLDEAIETRVKSPS